VTGSDDRVPSVEVREGKGTSNLILEQGLLGSPRLQKQAIPIALEILLIAIDQCLQFLQASGRGAGPDSNMMRKHSSLISAREQRELDQVIDAFWVDIEGQAEREIDQLGIKREGIEITSIYPLAVETMATMADIIFRKVKDQVVEKHFSKYSNDLRKLEYVLAKTRLGQSDKIQATLGAALLPMIVSKMEEFLAALVRIGITLYPKAMGELPNIPNEIFERYKANLSSADIHRWQIDQKVAAFLRGAPNDWQKSIQEWTKIDITNLGADWGMLTEMIQRRHALVHNSGRVDANYLHNVPDRLRHGLRLGSDLVTDLAYIEPVLIELETWGICLSFLWAKHFFKNDALYYPMTIDRVVRLEDLGRWPQAVAILDCMLREPIPSDQDIVMARINRIFCLQELGRDSESLKREIHALKTKTQDNVIDSEMKIGQLALLRDYGELTRALREATEGPEAYAQRRDLRDLPLIKRAMRDSGQVKTFLLGSGPRPPVQQGRGPRGRGARRRSR
jgi:hypothetical protein